MADIKLPKTALDAWAWGNDGTFSSGIAPGELKLARDFIQYKCWFYDAAAESGTCDTPRNMPFEELPDDIKRIKAKCRINRY